MRIIFFLDPHLSSFNPSSRRDDYPAAMLDKVCQVIDIAKEKNAEIIISGGDNFHVKNISMAYLVLVSALIKTAPCPVYSIVGNHDCVSEDTELLTKRGWIFYNEIRKDDLVYSLNSLTGRGEWVEIKRIIIKEFDGGAVVVGGGDIDLVATPEHRSIFQRLLNGGKYSKLKIESIIDAKGTIRVPKSAIKVGDVPLCISDDQLRVVAWILTDGWEDKNGYFSISQSKEEYIFQIRNLLNRLGYSFKEDVRRRKVACICGKKLKSIKKEHVFRIHASGCKKMREFFKGKYPFDDRLLNMSSCQFEIFIEELVKGDGSFYGSRCKEGTYLLYGSEAFLDKIQILAVLNGFSANVVEYRRGCYRLNVTKSSKAICQLWRHLKRVPYKGKVWCLSVSNENFMVRRGGKHFFTGNCYYDNLETIKRTPLGLFFASRVMHRLTKYNQGDVTIYGYDYVRDPKKPNFKLSEGMNILVAHQFANQNGGIDTFSYDDLMDFSIVFLGHDHNFYEPMFYSGSYIIRPGALSRGTQHMSNSHREIGVVYCDTETKVMDFIPLKVKPFDEVFLPESRIRLAIRKSVSEFVHDLAEGFLKKEASIPGLLNMYCQDSQVLERARYYLREFGII